MSVCLSLGDLLVVSQQIPCSGCYGCKCPLPATSQVNKQPLGARECLLLSLPHLSWIPRSRIVEGEDCCL